MVLFLRTKYCFEGSYRSLISGAMIAVTPTTENTASEYACSVNICEGNLLKDQLHIKPEINSEYEGNKNEIVFL